MARENNEEHRDLGPEGTRGVDTPTDTTVGDLGGPVELVYDASGPTRVELTLYPGSKLSVPAHAAAGLLAASPQFRRATAADDKFPGLRAGSDSGKQEDIAPGYDRTGARGAGTFDPAVVAANMPSIGAGNERSDSYAADVLKAAAVSEEGVRSGRDVAATIVGAELDSGRTAGDVAEEVAGSSDTPKRQARRG